MLVVCQGFVAGVQFLLIYSLCHALLAHADALLSLLPSAVPCATSLPRALSIQH